MNNSVNVNFNRTYNPSGPNNALSDIKRLLTSRDAVAQNRACNHLIGVINRYHVSSSDRTKIIEYLLDNDITVFLCEATSNLDFSLLRTITSCFRLLWSTRAFFTEDHASQCMTSLLRCLAHYMNSGSYGAVDSCLQFLCDLLTGIKTFEASPPLSRQSAYSAEQLLACLSTLAPKITNRRTSILSSSFVLQALVCYQPPNLDLKGGTGKLLAEVLKQWFCLLVGALNHSALIGERDEMVGMFYAVVCKLGMDVLRLVKLIREGRQETDFIQNILTDEQEITALMQGAAEMMKSVHSVIGELVMFTKDNQKYLPNEEYSEFLKFLLSFLLDNSYEHLCDFCDLLFANGYLTMLPQVQILRNNITVRKVSNLVQNEILKVLAQNHLGMNSTELSESGCAEDIDMGLSGLQNAIEMPRRMEQQMQQRQFRRNLVHIYFYCQSANTPQEASAKLLPYLIEQIMRIEKENKLPKYIIKALWLVFAISTVSNASPKSLEERILFEKVTDRLVGLLQPDPSVYYTHHHALIMWAFTSQRIVTSVRICILSQWLEVEKSLPIEISSKPAVWNLLLKVLVHNQPKQTLFHTLKALNIGLEKGDEEDRQDFAVTLWSMLPNVLSTSSIDCEFGQATNVVYILNLATTLLPLHIDDMLCLNIAVLISTMFTKTRGEIAEEQHHFEFVCLKLSLYLLAMSNKQNDNRVLTTFVNRTIFLSTVLRRTDSADLRVATTAAQLLIYIVMYYTKTGLQPKSVIEMETASIIKSLKNDSSIERGASILQLVYMVLNCGANTPLVLSDRLGVVEPGRMYEGLRAVMFRMQILCCKGSSSQSAAGWKTQSAIFNYAVSTKNDARLAATLTLQPWTHTLVHFQLTQALSEEFLNFVYNWLKLYRITLRNLKMKTNQMVVLKESLLYKTLFLLKKHLISVQDDPLSDVKKNIVFTEKEILDEYGCCFSQNYSQNF